MAAYGNPLESKYFEVQDTDAALIENFKNFFALWLFRFDLCSHLRVVRCQACYEKAPRWTIDRSYKGNLHSPKRPFHCGLVRCLLVSRPRILEQTNLWHIQVAVSVTCTCKPQVSDISQDNKVINLSYSFKQKGIGSSRISIMLVKWISVIKPSSTGSCKTWRNATAW